MRKKKEKKIGENEKEENLLCINESGPMNEKLVPNWPHGVIINDI